MVLGQYWHAVKSHCPSTSLTDVRLLQLMIEMSSLRGWHDADRDERTITTALLNTDPTQPGLRGWHDAGRGERTITTPLLNTDLTQPEDHRPDPRDLVVDQPHPARAVAEQDCVHA